MKCRVLLADDHPVWRRGLRDLLQPDFQIIGEANEGGEAVTLAREQKPDVAVIDIAMPGMDGIAATREIREVSPNTAVVVVSATCDDDQIFDSIHAGASGFVVKDDVPEAITEAVRNAAEGKAYLPPDIAKRVMAGVTAARNGQADPYSKGQNSLTSRETEVLRLMAQGRRHKEIAAELAISSRTVDNHVASIYNKLGIFDRASAIIYAVKKGLVRI